MDFVRFSGELFIYYVLMALGGGVLMFFTGVTFGAIGLDAERLIERWMLPCGAMGAVIVGAWLVEAKQSVVENMAPVLTRVFTPLFTAVLVTLLASMAWTRNGIDLEREVLIGFDLLLAVVLGLLLYAISARDPRTPPDLFDRVLFVLVASALVADGVALAAIAARISEFGFSPNRVAALGENLRPAREPGLVGVAVPPASSGAGAPSRPSSAGKPPTCRSTPSGRGWSSSRSRRCSASPEPLPRGVRARSGARPWVGGDRARRDHGARSRSTSTRSALRTRPTVA